MGTSGLGDLGKQTGFFLSFPSNLRSQVKRVYVKMIRDFLLSAFLLLTVQNIVQGKSDVCYSRIGCFSRGGPFWSERRPVSLLPASPDEILTKFLLSTRENHTATILDARYPLSFPTSWPNYKARPTKLIVHGFMDNYYRNESWMPKMTEELLKYGDYNVIVVDWHHGNRLPYEQAVSNTRVVGAQIADLMKTLQSDVKQASSDFHIIGHSLGAHIAGYAGERVPGTGRITGLDPAGLYFTNTEPTVRLDQSDAVFVDIVHTDGKSFLYGDFGTGQQLGHADFFPNLGHDQPGCMGIVEMTRKFGVKEAYLRYLKCEHIRSYEYYTESINSECPFTAFPCANEDDYLAGKCSECPNGSCSRMGFHADKSIPKNRTKYYLMTAENAPYCAYNIHISIKMSSKSPEELGKMKAKLIGDKNSTDMITLNKKPVLFKAGQTYAYTIPARDLGSIQSFQIQWKHRNTLTDPSKWSFWGLRDPSLIVEQVTITLHESKETFRFCPDPASMVSKKTVPISEKC